MRLFGLLVAVFVVLLGCSSTPAPSGEEVQASTPSSNIRLSNVSIQILPSSPEALSEPIRLAGTLTPYYEFEQAAYEKAVAEGKTVFLDFYASWCPICRKEEPEILAAFDELQLLNVVGFQVHYNDDETTAEETELAQRFGIAYQHTKLIVKDGDALKRTLEEMRKDEIKALILEFL